MSQLWDALYIHLLALILLYTVLAASLSLVPMPYTTQDMNASLTFNSSLGASSMSVESSKDYDVPYVPSSPYIYPIPAPPPRTVTFSDFGNLLNSRELSIIIGWARFNAMSRSPSALMGSSHFAYKGRRVAMYFFPTAGANMTYVVLSGLRISSSMP